MLGYRHRRQDTLTEVLTIPMESSVRLPLRMRRQGVGRQGVGRQGGRHPHFGLWPRPLDRLPRET